MVDHELDEHFRRSLGADYMNLFGKRLEQMKSMSSSSTATVAAKKSPQISPMVSETSARVKETTPTEPEKSSSKRDNVEKEAVVENIEMSVDDHFAKALGDTWKQLQQNNSNKSSTSSNHDENDLNSDPENDSNVKHNEDDRASPKSDISNRSDSQSHR